MQSVSLSSLFLTMVAELKDTMTSKYFPPPALLKNVKVMDTTYLGIQSAHECVWLVERKSETNKAASSIFDDGRSRTSER